MALVKPFRGVRPPKHLVEAVACRPYDVLSSAEARIEALDNELSLYRIIKPEIELDEAIDEHHAEVYQRAVDNFNKFQYKEWLVQDTKENYYVYAQTMNGRTQYGIVVCAHIEDYMTNRIKKHELTRRDKEEDRMQHVRINDANIEPVFLAYPQNKALDELVLRIIGTDTEYDFVTSDGFGHHFWLVNNAQDINEITSTFANIPSLYIADGHHRSAAAALVGAEKARLNPHHTGNEEYNYFMAVCFPDNQLNIIDYNRVVKDLNGLSIPDFLERLSAHFTIEKHACEMISPKKLHQFSIYLDGTCYTLIAKTHTYDDSNPIGVLDVTISSTYILDQILGITDLRSDKRIDFVGGIRGLGELKNLVDSGKMKLALALYPVTMQQLMNIADSDNIMPPKTTWFEPKLRSGLVIHKLR